MQKAVWAPVREFYKKTPLQRTSSAHRRAKPRTRNSFLVKGQGKGSPCFFPFHGGFRLCGGDQRAFRSPFGNLRPFAAYGGFHKKQIPCGRQEKSLPCFPRITEGFASAEATRGAFRSFRNLNRRGVPPLVSAEKGMYAQLPLAAMPAFPPGPLRGPSPKPNTGGGTAPSGSVPPPVLFYSALVSSNPAASSGCFLM